MTRLPRLVLAALVAVTVAPTAARSDPWLPLDVGNRWEELADKAEARIGDCLSAYISRIPAPFRGQPPRFALTIHTRGR